MIIKAICGLGRIKTTGIFKGSKTAYYIFVNNYLTENISASNCSFRNRLN